MPQKKLTEEEALALFQKMKGASSEKAYVDSLTKQRDRSKLEYEIDKYGGTPEIPGVESHGERATARVTTQAPGWVGTPLAQSDSAKVFADTGIPAFEPAAARKERESEEVIDLSGDARDELEALRKERAGMTEIAFHKGYDPPPEEDEALRVRRLQEIDARIEQLESVVGNEVDNRLIEAKKAQNAKKVLEVTGSSVQEAQQDAYTRLDELYTQTGSVVRAIVAFIEELESVGLTLDNLELTEEMLLGK